MKLNKFIVVILGILLVVTIIAATKASAEGAVLLSLENKYDDLVSQNQDLANKLVTSTSLTSVSKQAVGMGMGKPEKFIYMSATGIALR